ncbi:hypothetical protein [Flavobacterium croceum]|uniref:hypothetical protein n=1 Tax=Flavobacterium croceum TaxID=370975 RepID=UPI000CDA2CB5|nr:hypothetical protein [Flavobacterium croceum]
MTLKEITLNNVFSEIGRLKKDKVANSKNTINIALLAVVNCMIKGIKYKKVYKYFFLKKKKKEKLRDKTKRKDGILIFEKRHIIESNNNKIINVLCTVFISNF